MSLATILAVFVLLSPFYTSSTASANGDGSRSVYDAIEEFNFPMGLLPKGVTGYELDNGNGRFRAYLNGSCSFSLEGSYQLKYKSTITGTISPNKLSSLTGVSVKVLFLWLDIVEVTRSGDNLEFSVGIASAAFPIDNFYECPQCGFTIDSYKLKYKSTITGVVTTDKISSLSGIEVRVLFLWLSLVSVTRDDDELELSVGIASANFPVSNFDESPTCGCGFDCVNGKRMIKNLVSALLDYRLSN
ncbi:hypothetical protein DVH24_002638 [Malus domestica]|uniref:DUF538 domain-containing protein n=1 Tax=Malus domestica TaxID=3750 RepID=A0A498K326_MALDO|nr:hypothetical protein DVH24_002638 [Malus domestica]